MYNVTIQNRIYKYNSIFYYSFEGAGIIMRYKYLSVMMSFAFPKNTVAMILHVMICSFPSFKR